MTLEELRAEAEKQGFNLTKKRDYDCSCYLAYPNPLMKKKNGRWKCVDCMKYINPEEMVKKTKCVRATVNA